MALELMDEHEQGELVRNWLRQNAVAILLGVVAGIGGIIGWQQWQSHKKFSSAEAQIEYREFGEALERKDDKAALQALDTLQRKYKDSPYAAFAALRQAQSATSKGDAAAAVVALEWARDNAPLPALKELATLRLARAKLGSGDANGAIALLDQVKDAGYQTVIAELRGDALVALGRKDEARAQYEEALTLLDPTSRERYFVEMKRDDLSADAVAAVAAPAAPATPAPATPAPAATPAAEEAKS